jgi:predicted NBD/HSP70 family sugar kinase
MMKPLDSASTGKDAIRRKNLSALLRHVHLEGTVSRAALGETLGLSKTTIAELVSELVDIDLLVRVGNEQSGSAGRPSQLVAASREPMTLVVNPEIDGLTMALVNFFAEIVDMYYIELDGVYSVETTTALVSEYLHNNRQLYSGRLQGVVLALPGAIDASSRKLINAPSLGWRDIDVAQEFEKALSLRVWVVNNARAATISEHSFGAAKGLANAICLFSGVGGIGGGLVVNNQVLEGSSGLAGEIGKMRLFADGPRKHLTFGELMHREEIVTALGKTRLTDEALDELLSQTKDAAVHRVIDAQVAVLMSAIETLRDLFDPEVILLGGYLGSLVASRKSQIVSTLNSTSLKYRDEDFLVPRAAELKPMVLLGAAELAWEEILSNPLGFTKKRAKGNG